MTLEKVIEVQKYGREGISLHTPLGEHGDSEFGDLIEDSEATQPGEAVSFTLLQEQPHSVRRALRARGRCGVHGFGLTGGQPKTLDEIGKVLRGHPGAVPADRVQDHVQAAPPVPIEGPPGTTSTNLTDGRQPQDVTCDARPPGSWTHGRPKSGRPAS